MQSEDRSAIALEALRRPRDTFDAAVIAAIDELNAFIASQKAPAHERVTLEGARLGEFADGRVDAERFTAIVGAAAAVTPSALARMGSALDLLNAFRGQRNDLYRVRVEPGTDLRDTVRDALAVRGRLFNAGRHVELLRAGGEVREVDEPLGFSAWRRTERQMAPPLVVDVHGADLVTDGLGEYLDGGMKIVLVVSGAAPAAPLARLIGPDTFVMQTADPAAVRRLGEFSGAGIAAVLPEGCAEFVHDPAAGARLAQRLTATLTTSAPRAPGRVSARRQAEDLAWLRELVQLAEAERDRSQPDVTAESATPEPVDQLAGWLLQGMTRDAAGSEAV